MSDGIKLDRKSGAVLHWFPSANWRDHKEVPPSYSVDRTKPGSFIAGPDGHRFFNEAAPYQELVRIIVYKKIELAYFIGNKQFLQK